MAPRPWLPAVEAEPLVETLTADHSPSACPLTQEHVSPRPESWQKYSAGSVPSRTIAPVPCARRSAIEDSVRCPICGTLNPTGSRFCHQCGTRLAEACPTCGFVNLPEARFCNSCGTRLSVPVSPGLTAVESAGQLPPAPLSAG